MEFTLLLEVMRDSCGSKEVSVDVGIFLNYFV